MKAQYHEIILLYIYLAELQRILGERIIPNLVVYIFYFLAGNGLMCLMVNGE